MSKVHIELDLEVVQKAVNAKIEPAVEKILASVDLPALIEKALLQKPTKGDRYLMPMTFFYDGGSGQRPIDDLVDAAIHAAAKDYVKKAVKRERAKIEAAFEETLRNSASRLAKTMIGSLDSALDNDWSFKLDTRMSAKGARVRI